MLMNVSRRACQAAPILYGAGLGRRARTSGRPAPEPDFSSSHTANFPHLLAQLGISLAVSTYQAGKLILLRARGGELNTHFRHFESPMGIAWDDRRLALGTRGEIWDFRNQPAVAARIEPAGTHDAAFLPRRRHYTGDIRIHEIGWIGDELWAANTRFSCLCTFDRDHSFVPQLATAFHHGAGAGRSLPPERAFHRGGADSIRHLPGRDERAGRLARE